MNIIKKTLQSTEDNMSEIQRQKKYDWYIYMFAYGYISVCAILDFYFSNFIT